MNPEQFEQALQRAGFALTSMQRKQFNLYFQELTAANQHVNLTRITSINDVYLKHFFDSLTPLLTFKDLFPKGVNLCDVGAGAGFPSLPLKIVRPDLQITIVDSLAKRLKFLAKLLPKLGLKDVQLVHGRAEDIGQNVHYRQQFTLVTARAVAKMAVLSEYCLPLVKENGYFIALKGPQVEQELADSQKALHVLGGHLQAKKEIVLPNSDEKRSLLVIRKVKKTPAKYPRQAGTPRRKPIH